MIAEETSKFEKNVLLERLVEAKIAAAPVMTVADVANDPHFRDERSMYTEVTHPQLGPVRITNQAVKMSETNPYVRGCAPLLGEHNDEVYQFLGFTPEEISAWREKGVI
ncbi:CoA transferase [Clostridium phoceensis]|uniref:CoA transferase n=1 Tax=Clostridium phoceensis TaxID=1650661 RepID=UPI00266F4561|nr:CoA transferase [Clostridium phoceensis]